MANILADPKRGDCDKSTNYLKSCLSSGEGDHRNKSAKWDIGSTSEAIQEQDVISIEMECQEGDTLEMPILLPHYASNEFKKLKPQKKKCRYPILINVKTKESVGNTKQVWCMICDRFFPSLEVLRSHIVVRHGKEPIGLNEATTATWNILHLVGLPPEAFWEKRETLPTDK